MSVSTRERLKLLITTIVESWGRILNLTKGKLGDYETVVPADAMIRVQGSFRDTVNNSLVNKVKHTNNRR